MNLKYYLRRYYWRFKGVRMGRGCVFNGNVFIHDPHNLTLGDFVTLNHGVVIVCVEPVVIGSNTHISPYAQIHTGKLDTSKYPLRHVFKPLVIGSDVWIASGAVVCKSVPDKTVIGANEVYK